MHPYPPVHFSSPKLGPDPPLPYESLGLDETTSASFSVIEIKHNVYGKRERQKYHLTMIFPPFSRLPFSTRRGLGFRVRQQREYLFEVFLIFLLQLSACVRPRHVLYIFTRKQTG